MRAVQFLGGVQGGLPSVRVQAPSVPDRGDPRVRALVCKYGISYRDLAEMMQERGVIVDHTTIVRWVQRYAPEIEQRVRWYQGYRSPSWRVDETYVRVGGAWKYLFRAVDRTGRLIDFMLSDRRNTRAAHRSSARP
jgi:transposase-like protein